MKIYNNKGAMEHKTIKDNEGNIIEETRTEPTTEKGFEINSKEIKAIGGVLIIIASIVAYFVS